MTLPAAPTWELEETLWRAGVEAIAGLDEAGRGALAGPLVAAAVVFGPEARDAPFLRSVRDSKQLTPQARAALVEGIVAHARGWALGWASWEEVDRLGPAQAARLAFVRALRRLPVRPQFVLTDYELLPEEDLNQVALVKGDRRSLAVAAASVLAKTARDAYMQGLHRRFPRYAFERNKGYGTRAHREAVRSYGPVPVHRRRFLQRVLQGLSSQEEP